jgi:CRP-like cAMP-binding protein
LSVFENPVLFEKLVSELVSLIVPVEEEKNWKNCSKLLSQLLLYKSQSSNLFLAPSSSDPIPSPKTEQLLYSLYLMVDNLHFSDLPSKEEALNSFRMYRNILHHFNYNLVAAKKKKNYQKQLKDGNGGGLSLMDEFLAFLNLLSIISRTIYVTYTNAAAFVRQETGVDAHLHAMNAIAGLSSPQGGEAGLGLGMNNNNQQQGGAQQKRAAVYDNLDMNKLSQEIKIHPKTEKIQKLLKSVVQQNILFRNFQSEEHNKIVDAFEFMAVKAGEIVIKQGDSGEYFYIVESGLLDVYMESCGLRIKVGRTLCEGDYFGELALMYNTPRAATVISTEASNLWRIDRQTYRTIVTYHNKTVSDEFFGLVSNVTILGKRLGDVLSHAELNKVVSTLEMDEFEDNAVIIRQHQTGDYFYIISEGQVDVWQETVANNNKKDPLGNKVATLKKGDCFGEKALLADDVRQATCISVGKVICLSLSRDDFIAMIGNWQDITNVDPSLTHAVKKANKIRQSVYDSQYHISLHLDDIEQLNTLGVGAFGKVKLARHKSTAQLYALKKQSKAFIVSQNMQDMILNEMNIMKQIDHPFISKLHASIQDKKYIYFLLELLPGGEFFSFLQTAGKLTEDRSRFYSASVILGLEELHKNKIAYRDLKPENMVMDGRGYVKLVDFGLAKQILSGSTWSALFFLFFFS